MRFCSVNESVNGSDPCSNPFTFIRCVRESLYYYYGLSEGFDTSKIVYEISKSFDFIEITLIVKSRKCLHTTSANSDIFATCTCHVSLHECSREDV